MFAVLGVVPTMGRERLSGLDLAGEPLFVCATRTLVDLPCTRTLLVAKGGRRAMAAAALVHAHLPEVEVVDNSGVETHVRALGGDAVVVVHDPLCPLTPVAWVRDLVHRARQGAVMVAVLPVVDTLKTTREGVVTGTVDRTALHVVSSPIVFPARALVDAIPALGDPTALVDRLRSRHDVELVAAPGLARRVDDQSGIELLAAVEASSYGMPEG
ncbi:MAG: 2-C-methyl-D-erythritol 4-phosphate cytidylyltransferase [Nocardioidaceae bacterium]